VSTAARTRPSTHATIYGYALKLGSYAVPCSAVSVIRDDSDDLWTVTASDVPLDALRLLRGAIGPSVEQFTLELTDHAGCAHRARGLIPRSAPQEAGYRLAGDDMSFVFKGRID